MKIQPPFFFAACCVMAVGITNSLRSPGIGLPTLSQGIHLLSLTSASLRSGILVTRDPLAGVNVRSAPSINANLVVIANPNEAVTILAETQRPDGYLWYQVRLATTGREGWVRGDLVRLTGATAELTPTAASPAPEAVDYSGNPYGFPEYNTTRRPAASVPPSAIANPLPPAATPPTLARPNGQPGAIAPVPGSVQGRELIFDANQPNLAAPTRPPSTPTSGVGVEAPAPEGIGEALQRAGATAVGAINAVTDRVGTLLTPARQQPTQFTQAQIDYFMEVALGSEWGTSNQTVRKWTQNLRIKVSGARTNEDTATINRVIGELNELIRESGVQLTLDNNNPNVEIIYAPETEFSRLEPNYVPGNLGFFWTYWNGGALNRARILITSTNRVTQRERSHLLREELTQVMGLMRDSWRYRDSIFYQGWTDVNQYTANDRAIIQILYLSNIRPGMSRSQVASAIRAASAQRQTSSD